jgi:dTDP-4-amino-4,6-dideoxygalactose transaminase
LEAADRIQARRRQVWEYYRHHLNDWAEAAGVRLPCVPAHCEQTYHMFYLMLPSLAQRQAFIENLKARGIMSVFHYLPLHLSPMGRSFGGKPGDCPVTEQISDRLVRLPFYMDLTEADQARIVSAIKEVGGV